MKLKDKRFWKFEATMLLCGFLVFCEMVIGLIFNAAEFESCRGAVLILLIPVLCLYFAISGIPAWLLYKGNSWLKLAGYLYLISALLVIVPMLVFLFDWNPITANIRPGNIALDEGKYFTDNELIIMISVMWSVLLIIPVMITSYLTKRRIKNK